MNRGADGATVRTFIQARDGSLYLVSTTTALGGGNFVAVLPNPQGVQDLDLGPFQ